MDITERERRRQLMNLPPTDEVKTQMQYELDHTHISVHYRLSEPHGRKLAECAARDAILATRPPGCWCLGTGMPRQQMSSEPKFCHCADGQASQVVYEAEEKLKRDRRNAEINERLAARMQRTWLEDSGIPSLFLPCRFSTWPNAQANANLVDRLAPRPQRDGESDDEYYDTVFVPWEQSWYLHGSYGTGKTGAAVSHAYERLKFEKATTLVFWSVPQLLQAIKNSYNSDTGPTEGEIIDRAISAELLILDDLGVEQVKDTGWVVDRLYQIIGARHDEQRATIFTSNDPPAATADRLGDRITWRIIEMCNQGKNVVKVVGDNLRAKPQALTSSPTKRHIAGQ